MKPVALRRLGGAALVLAFVSLGVIGWLSQREWRDFERSRLAAGVTNQVLSLNQRVLAELRDAETGQRGFLLTGHSDYLTPYRAAVAAAPEDMRKLLALTASHPRQLQRVKQLQEIAGEKRAEMGKTIELRQNAGIAAALAVVDTGRGKRLMDEFRGLSDEIETSELNQRAVLVDAVERGARQARTITLVGIWLLAVLVVGAFSANHRSASRQERLILQLAAANRSGAEVRDLLRTTFYSIADAVITTDRNGDVRLMNAAAERLTGWVEADARGQKIENVFRMSSTDGPSVTKNPALVALSTGQPQTAGTNHSLTPRSGAEIAIDVSAAPIQSLNGAVCGSVLVFRDVSEMRRNQERLREAAKLESLGVLAGGIAHDFNNLLVGILGNSSLLADYFPPGSPGSGVVSALQQAGDRAAQLTRQMLAYSGRGKFVVEPLNLSREVEQITALVAAAIPKNVELRLNLARELPTVEADAAQMQQLVMNLVINGAEAIGPAQGFTEVATSTAAVGSGQTLNGVTGDGIRPGNYVVLTVTDNGRGMDAATRARIFDPFFTTKFTGRGLGLAAVLGIVKGHGGGIQVDSTPGKGTTFRVFLAASRAAAATESQPAVLLDSPPGMARGKIIVADDEEVVLRVAKAVLERAGFQVLLARNGAEAVEILRGQPAEIGIVLLDMTMPVMTGEEALPKLKAIRNDVRVIASSGYNEIEALKKFGGSIHGFLQKPYTATQLNDKVRAALSQSSPSPARPSLTVDL